MALEKILKLGFILLLAFPNGSYSYLGNQIRPRVTVPDSWKWSFGASLSAEFGFFRPNDTADFLWQGKFDLSLIKLMELLSCF